MNKAYTPGIGNAPYGNLNANPQASNYQGDSGYSAAESILLRKVIKEILFDAAPEQYNALKLLYAKPFKEVASDEWTFLEYTFGRTAIIAGATAAAVPASAGNSVQQTITLVTGGTDRISVDLIINYPDNTKAVVKSISGNDIVVESPTDGGLPAVSMNDIFSIQSTIIADGMDSFSNYERLETVERYNYIQMFLRAARWSRVELLKYQNLGTTNYLDVDKGQRVKQLRIDLFNTFFNGQRGEFRLKNNYVAKSTGGIFPTMVAAGSANANPTLSGLKAAFETLAFQTNFKKEGSTRFVYGTEEVLYDFSKIYKQPGLRYAPNDDIAKLDLKKIELGSQNYVLVPCELFREQSCFPAEWARKILVLDQETISPVKMKGLPEMEMGSTLDRGDNGSREDFKDWWVRGQLGVEFNNPIASFYMDLQ